MSIGEELHKGEKIKKELGIHPLEYSGFYVLGIVLALTVVGAIIGIPIIIITELIRRGNKYYITDKRIIHQFTFLSRKTSSAFYDKIQDIHFTQGVSERIFGIGKIHINTAGTHLIEIVFKGVQNPISVKRMIENNMIN